MDQGANAFQEFVTNDGSNIGFNQSKSSYDETRRSRLTSFGPILFGGCNRQNLPQDHWARITSLIHPEPELFIWTGDAVYAQSNSIKGLESAYAQLLGPPPPPHLSAKDRAKWVPPDGAWPSPESHYLQFLKTTKSGKADGIWDDHDMGVNDAGGGQATGLGWSAIGTNYVPDIATRAQRYVDFIEAGDSQLLDNDEGMATCTKDMKDDKRMTTCLESCSQTNPVNVNPEAQESCQHQSNPNKFYNNWKQNFVERKGLYHVRDIDRRFITSSEKQTSENRKTVGDQSQQGAFLRIIFLDTRYAREPHFIPSLGHRSFPWSAMLSAVIRTITNFIGFGFNYRGQLLGEEQWRWLENILKESSPQCANTIYHPNPQETLKSVCASNLTNIPDYTIIISSIQILTTNPAVESWGHFPSEKIRLLDLLKKYDPPNLLFLSSDVHHAEVSSLELLRGEEPTQSLEGDVEDDEQDWQPPAARILEQEVTTPKTTNITVILASNTNAIKNDPQPLSRILYSDRWNEITSSGLTHTCVGDRTASQAASRDIGWGPKSYSLNGLLCPLMLNTYNRHRDDHGIRQPSTRSWWRGDMAKNSSTDMNTDGFFISHNIGSINFDSKSLNVSVHDLATGEARLTKVVYNSLHPSYAHLGPMQQVLHANNSHSLPLSTPLRYPIQDMMIKDFYRFPRDGHPYVVTACLLALQFLFIYFAYFFVANVMKPLASMLWQSYVNSSYYSVAWFGKKKLTEQEKLFKLYELKYTRKTNKMKRKCQQHSNQEETRQTTAGIATDDNDEDIAADAVEYDSDLFNELSSDSSDDDEEGKESSEKKKDKQNANSEDTAGSNCTTTSSLQKNETTVQTDYTEEILRRLPKFDKSAIYSRTEDGGLMSITATPQQGSDACTISYRFLPSPEAMLEKIKKEQDEKHKKTETKAKWSPQDALRA